jgi:hypothetical protein
VTSTISPVPPFWREMPLQDLLWGKVTVMSSLHAAPREPQASGTARPIRSVTVSRARRHTDVAAPRIRGISGHLLLATCLDHPYSRLLTRTMFGCRCWSSSLTRKLQWAPASEASNRVCLRRALLGRSCGVKRAAIPDAEAPRTSDVRLRRGLREPHQNVIFAGRDCRIVTLV